MPVKSLCAALAALFLAAGAAAAETPDIKRITAALRQVFPHLQVDHVRATPVAGLYQVEVGPDVFYATGDGRYALIGSLVDTGAKRNLTQDRRRALVAATLGGLDEARMIVIGPQKARHELTVFTDVDCPWCARFHQDVPALNREGVQVRYLLYPRAGLKSDTFKRSVAVWCAADRAEAIGVAKAGGKLELKTCDNPVAEHYALGQQLGVEGTPTMFLDDGTRIGGYVPVARLLAAMGIQPKATPTAAR